MARYTVTLSHEVQFIEAEKFNQTGDFVSFYKRDKDKSLVVIALVRLGHGDSVVERVANAEAST